MMLKFLLIFVILISSILADDDPVAEPYLYRPPTKTQDPFEFKLSMVCTLKKTFRFKIQFWELDFFDFKVFGDPITNLITGHAHQTANYVYTGMLDGYKESYHYQISAFIDHDCNLEDRLVTLQVNFWPQCKLGEYMKPRPCRRHAFISLNNMEGNIQKGAGVLNEREQAAVDGFLYVS